ncbi:MAG: hypothetical protein VX733_10495 [Candidatus Latescibacterota bacterium]|nr:hypothetical protein [Candidatus Latescibacterota bacterium]
MIPLDYGRSFLIGNGPENEVRFWVESRTRLFDEHNHTVEDYLQAASCKSEYTFAERDLFVPDNYDFLPVFGPQWSIVYRRRASAGPGYREVRHSNQWWGGQQRHLIEAGSARLLEINEEVRAATYDQAPIVAQIEIANADTGLRAIIECPVKTMNTRRDGDLYQVDTGPVVLPDLTVRHERPVDGFKLAFVAFNASDFADFVAEVETPVKDGVSVFHYSEIQSLVAVNRLYAVS